MLVGAVAHVAHALDATFGEHNLVLVPAEAAHNERTVAAAGIKTRILVEGFSNREVRNGHREVLEIADGHMPGSNFSLADARWMVLSL